MKSKDILALIEHYKTFSGTVDGDCYDCGKPVKVIISVDPNDGRYTILGGAVWTKEFYQGPTLVHELTLKCDKCYEKAPELKDQDCEVYSRIVGYLRPLAQWNPGKTEEFHDRALYKIEAPND